MKSETYPLALPSDLLKEIRKTAKATGLSMADTMRQSIKLGAPKLREKLAPDRLKPFTKEEARRAYCIPNQEFESAVDMVKRVIDLIPPDAPTTPSAPPTTHHHDHHRRHA